MPVGSFVLVLHGHVPHVLNHGRWPHGEHWLFEAAAEVWLPLLGVLEGASGEGRRSPITLALSPVLLEQLDHDDFKQRFAVYLAEREQRAHADERGFGERGDEELAGLARRWADRYMDLADRFEALDRDLPAAYAELWRRGAIEVLSSCATHALQPQLRHDASRRAQLRVGLQSSERILGARPVGVWLPECAWQPDGRPEGLPAHAGTDKLLADEGVEYTVLDGRLFRGARSEGLITERGFQKVGWDQAGWDAARGWRSPLEPHLASSRGEARGVAVLGRHGEVCDQVWSGQMGYPVDSRYLEFHKTHGPDGLRYWRVQAGGDGLNDDARYDAEAAGAALGSHAQHFCAVVRSALRRHHRETGREGAVVAAFDASLFGHWWHEGPEFLAEVLRRLSEEEEIALHTGSELLAARPPDKVAWFPAGSSQDAEAPTLEPWMRQLLDNAEDRYGQLCITQPWRDDDELRALLEQAGRELLLMQASDWPYAVAGGGAPDYGAKRLAQHGARFDRVCDMVVDRSRGLTLTAVQRAVLTEAQVCDPLFPALSIEAWRDGSEAAEGAHE